MDYEAFLHWDMANLEVIFFFIYVLTRHWGIPILLLADPRDDLYWGIALFSLDDGS